MQNSLERILSGLQESLRTIIAPAVTDPYLSSQIGAIAEIIGNLATRVEWRCDQLLETVSRVRPVLELAAPQNLPLTAAVVAGPAPDAATANPELLAARDAHLHALREVQHRLEAHPDAAVEGAIRDFLRWQVAAESALLRTGIFSAPKDSREGPS